MKRWRVDTLCLDKTGTITEGTMKVEDVQLYDTAQTTVVQHTAKFDPETGEPVQNVSALKPEVTVSAEKENGQIQETVNSETVSQEERQKLQEIDHIMGNMMSVLHDQNATADALKALSFRNDLKLIHAIPFSSDRKYSGAVFEGRGTYLMGAAQFLFRKEMKNFWNIAAVTHRRDTVSLFWLTVNRRQKERNARQDLNRWDCFSSLT